MASLQNSSMLTRSDSSISTNANSIQDFQLRLDLAYNKYLQLLMEKYIFEKKFETIMEEIDDSTASILMLHKRLLNELQSIQSTNNKIEFNQNEKKIIESNAFAMDSLLGVDENDVCVSLENIIYKLQKSCEHVVLKNIKFEANPEKYKTMIELLEIISTLLKKITDYSTNSNVEKVADISRLFYDKFSELHALSESIVQLTNCISNATALITCDELLSLKVEE